jgi:hypothetical protein
LYLEA